MTMFNKFYFLCVCVIGALAKIDYKTFPESTQDLMKTLHDTCLKEVGVSEELIAKAIDGDLVEDDKLKCYSKCLMVEAGVMDEKTGDISVAIIEEILPENLRESYKENLQRCAEKSDNDDLCEKAFDMFKCNHDLNPENFIFM
ncbi:general odorant-binding protein 83a-like [Aethina tumida]|uniref:general odorant-binding protein 83a-like n=1 Tax=Aethina tumida TaxID=116153 RepID=UPI00096AEEA7|nr:general odorant-binding protein 83a-like [Aethina tumida]